MDCRSLYDLWCEKVTDPELQADLKAMDESGDEAVIEDAFYRTLEFGTAGLRGVLGAGTNRMNIHTVGQATQGIANFIKGQANDGEPGTVAICYDSRINSQLFAHTAASVLAANGIKSYVYPRLQPTPALSFATRYLAPPSVLTLRQAIIPVNIMATRFTVLMVARSPLISPTQSRRQ